MSLLTATIFPASNQEEVVVLEDNIIMFVFIAMKYACNSFDRILAMNYACNSFEKNGHSITYWCIGYPDNVSFTMRIK